eukprot:TRINITY_DN4660_c0_g2_i3.p1 TRINITY_DN4660_c0_g2~~TRINITY_DN4660_c0_g2_i3.p1  ORF type:complete len:738 (-),score=129.91 TRINITY_DN4660_c0_g2_i3:529-2742(-)
MCARVHPAESSPAADVTTAGGGGGGEPDDEGSEFYRNSEQLDDGSIISVITLRSGQTSGNNSASVVSSSHANKTKDSAGRKPNKNMIKDSLGKFDMDRQEEGHAQRKVRRGVLWCMLRWLCGRYKTGAMHYSMSIRTMVLILTEVAVLCTVIPVWVLWYTTLLKSNETVVNVYFDAMSYHTKWFLDDVFSIGERLVYENVNEACNLPLCESEQELVSMWRHLQGQAQVAQYSDLYIYMAYETGAFVSAGIDLTVGATSAGIQSADTNYTFYAYYVANSSDVGFYLTDEAYTMTLAEWDSRTRVWYQDAILTQGLVWSSVYTYVDNQLGLTVSAPLRCGNGTPCGVVAVDFYLNFAVKRLVSTIQIGESGSLWVSEPNGDLITSTRNVSVSAYDATGTVTRVKLWEADDHLTRALGKLKRGHLNASKPEYQTANLAGTMYQVYTECFSPRPGTPLGEMVILMVVPYDDYYGDVASAKRKTIGMSAGLIVFFALVILIATSLMLRPLRLLRQQMGSAARLEGDFLRSRELPFSWSPLSEISSIAYSLFKMKQMLTSFSRYVPMQVVTWLIRRDKIASLGVRKTYCTTMFCDIADFTSLTERTAPSVLMEVFTEFMDTVCASTMRNNGTIDKIIGDCVMAFWGSPDEVPNQEEDACRNALECRAALQKAQALWASNGLPVFRARIGMAAGTVLAGNSGASDRFQFTVLGDPVNLASRLEGLNKGGRIQLTAQAELPKLCN